MSSAVRSFAEKLIIRTLVDIAPAQRKQIAYMKQRRGSSSKAEKTTGGLGSLGAWPTKAKKEADSAKVCCRWGVSFVNFVLLVLVFVLPVLLVIVVLVLALVFNARGPP